MQFTSDNAAAAAPEILAAVAAANTGSAPSYGADPWSARATDLVRAAFEAPEAAVYLVATGTAANALALATLVQPWQAVFCHGHAHIHEDECGAPEFYTGGAKLVTLPGAHGKIDPAALDRALSATGANGVHGVQRGALSITNATESGTVYTPAEVAALSARAHAQGVPVHMDGARFANALVATGATPAEMTWKAGVDVLSFGGTKNGCLGVEAVVIFDPARAWEFELRRKRAGHLFSKSRYLGAQMAAYLEGGLWLDLARRANASAHALAAGLSAIPGTRLDHPVQANAVFASLPRGTHRAALAAGAGYYLWPGDQSLDGPDDDLLGCRLVASWATTEADIAAFLDLIRVRG